MVVEAFSVHCLIKYRDREIQSLIMRVMQYVVGRQKMWTLESLWTGKMSLFEHTTLQLNFVQTLNGVFSVINITFLSCFV